MKNKLSRIATFLLIAALLVISAFANDGNSPIGNRNCGGANQQACPTPTPAADPIDEPVEEDPFAAIIEYLNSIFG